MNLIVFKRGLIAGVMALTPFMSMNGVEVSLIDNIEQETAMDRFFDHDGDSDVSSSSAHRDRQKKQSAKRQRLTQKLAFLFSNETVYFNGFAFADLDLQRSLVSNRPAAAAYMEDNSRRLDNNAQLLAQVIFPKDPVAQKLWVTALSVFIQAGKNYVNVLFTTGNPDSPQAAQVLNEEWLPAADALGTILGRINSKVLSVSDAQLLFETYTRLLARMSDQLTPSFILTNPTTVAITVNPDFTGASFTSQQARVLLAQELAPLLAKALTKK